MQKLCSAVAPLRQTFAALGGAQAVFVFRGVWPHLCTRPPRGRQSSVAYFTLALPVGQGHRFVSTRLLSPRSLRHVAYIPRCFFSGALKKTTIKTPPRKAGLQPPQGGVFTQTGRCAKADPDCKLQTANCKTSKKAGTLLSQRFFYCTTVFISGFISVSVSSFDCKYLAFCNSF